MRKASKQIIFINTSPPEERVELLKPFGDMKEIDDDCEEIYTGGLLKRYCKHPPKLEHPTLADWAAWYGLLFRVEEHRTRHQNGIGFVT